MSQGYLPTAGGGARKDDQWPAIYDAVVAVATDPTGAGRVRMYVPQVLGTTMSNWAIPMQPGLIPAVKQRIFALFLGGNPDLPYYLLGITSGDLQNIAGNTGLVLNSNPYFTGNVITGYTGSNGTVAAVQPNADTDPPYTYGIQLTSTGSGGGYIQESAAEFAAGPNQPYQVSSWVYYPAGGTVNVGMGFLNPSKVSLGNTTKSVTVPASTWTNLSQVVNSPATAAFGYPVVGPATSTVGQQFTAQAVQVIGQIPGSLIQASTITSTQVAGGILNLNPYFAGLSTAGWTGVGGTLTATATPPTGSPYPYSALLAISSGTNSINGSPQPFGAVSGLVYQLTGWVYCSTAMTVNFGFGWLNSSGVFNVNTTASHSIAATTWTQLQTVQTANTSTSTGYGYAYVSSTSSSGTYYLTEAVVSEQVQGGALASGTVTGTQVAGSTITGSNIAAATIAGSNIAAATITGSNITANTITSSQIAANTITASQIAANTITASQIAANTITASQIQAGTITASQIAANTITGSNIVASVSLTTPVISSPSITGGTITGGKIIGDGSTQEVMVYSGTPASGNLLASISDAGGTDGHGNTYLSGITSYAKSGSIYYACQSDGAAINFSQASSVGGTYTDIVTMNPINSTQIFTISAPTIFQENIELIDMVSGPPTPAQGSAMFSNNGFLDFVSEDTNTYYMGRYSQQLGSPYVINGTGYQATGFSCAIGNNGSVIPYRIHLFLWITNGANTTATAKINFNSPGQFDILMIMSTFGTTGTSAPQYDPVTSATGTNPLVNVDNGYINSSVMGTNGGNYFYEFEGIITVNSLSTLNIQAAAPVSSTAYNILSHSWMDVFPLQ